MNTQNTNYRVELVKDFDGTYYANVTTDNGKRLEGLPEYVTYKQLKAALAETAKIELPTVKSLEWKKCGRKQYADIDLKGRNTKRDEMGRDPKEVAFYDNLAIFVGDRVTSKHYCVQGVVTGTEYKNGEKLYIVKFDKPVKCFWTGQMTQETSFSRYGITKNYDPLTSREKECNALYYAEELQATYYMRDIIAFRFKFTDGDTTVNVHKPTGRGPKGDRWRTVIKVADSEPVTTWRTLYDLSRHLQVLREASI